MISQKMKSFSLIRTIAAIAMLLLLSSPSFAQLKDEIQEKKIKQLDQETLEKKQEDKKSPFTSSVALEGTFDTNPRFAASGKPDESGRVKYATAYKKLLSKSLILNLNYNLDGTFYSEFTDLTNIFNYARIGLDKSINKSIAAGVGYDFSSFYYPQEEDTDYVYHKAFLYLKHNITKDIFHQVRLEEGFKYFMNARPNSTSTSSFLDGHRKDFRHAVEYSIGFMMLKKFSFRMRAKYSINDSNALFQKYHDYATLDLSPSISFRITDKLGANLSFMFTDKDYAERLVLNGVKIRRDRTYSPSLGFNYNVTKNQLLTLSYSYTTNVSNDPTGEYKSNSIMGGWKYSF